MPWFRRKKLRTFTLDINPVMGSVTPGESASASVVVKSSSPEVTSVNLSACTAPESGGLSAGLKVSFSPPLGVPPFSSVMNISTSPELAPSVYPFLVVATGGDMKQSATYTLILRSRKPAAKKAAAEELVVQSAQEQTVEESGPTAVDPNAKRFSRRKS